MDKHIYEISKNIALKIVGGASKDEAAAVEKWEKEDALNQERLNLILDEEYRKNIEDKKKEFSVDESWKEIKAKIESTNSPRINRSSLFTRIAIFSAAASIVAAILITALYYRDETIVGPENIKMAQNTAYIETSVGEIVNIDSVADVNKIAQFVKLRKNKEIKQKTVKINKVVVPKGAEVRFTLPDSSTVFLFPESELKFPTEFDEKHRNVELKGEGFFEVKRDAERPFTVKTDDVKVKVLGTKFNVKSYDNEDIVETALVRGSVDANGVILTPDKAAVYNKETKEIIVKDIIGEDYLNRMSSVLVFYNKTLKEIFTELQRWYDFEYSFLNEDIAKLTYSFKVQKDEDLSELFHMLEMTDSLKFRFKNKRVIVSK